MNIAITGSNGFIGNHLTQYLHKRGYNLKLINRKKDSKTNGVKSIDAKTDYSKILINVDVIIHCASIVHQPKSQSRDINKEYTFINIEGTRNLAEQAVKFGVKRFIFISSIKVNGEYTKFGEEFNNDSIPSPQDAYSISKFYAEKELIRISKESQLEVVIIRPPLVYGPYVKANFLNLMTIIKLGLPLPFLGIENKRSLIYVQNLISFICKCITHPNAAGKTLLISDSKLVSTPELIKLLSIGMKQKPLLFYVPKLILFIFSRLFRVKSSFDRLTNSLIINPTTSYKLLDWEPPYDQKQGLVKTAQWYISRNK